MAVGGEGGCAGGIPRAAQVGDRCSEIQRRWRRSSRRAPAQVAFAAGAAGGSVGARPGGLQAAALVLVARWAALVFVAAQVQAGGGAGGKPRMAARRGRLGSTKEEDGVIRDGFKTLRVFLQKSKYTVLRTTFLGRRE